MKDCGEERLCRVKKLLAHITSKSIAYECCVIEQQNAETAFVASSK